MFKKITLLLLIITSGVVMAQDLDQIEKDIRGLSGDAVQKEWEAISTSDQSTREAEKFDSDADIINLYKVVLMEHYHGYPTNKLYGYPAYTTPWVVWIHCPNTALAQYTFPIILKGRDLQQLPEDRFPNYFVGGLLLHIYGLDMEFDTDFHTNGVSPIARMLYRLEEERHEINLDKLKKLTGEALAINKQDVTAELGKWSIQQHGTIVTFSIAKLKKDFYLMRQNNGGSPMYSKLRLKNENLDYLDFEEGYGHYHLENKDGDLLLKDHKDTTIKILKCEDLSSGF